MSWKCPKCGENDLDVQISTWARLAQDGEEISTDADDAQNGDHEWDEKSLMQCRDCGHCEASKAFGVEGTEPEEEADEPEDEFEICDCGRNWRECTARDYEKEEEAVHGNR